MKSIGLQLKILLLVAGAMGLAVAVSVTGLASVYGSLRDLERINAGLLQDYRKAIDDFRKADGKAEDRNRTASAARLEAQAAAIAQGKRATHEAVAGARDAYLGGLAGTVAVMLAALLALWIFLRRAVLGPISRAVEFAERIAAGDLTATVKTRRADEAGQLLGALGRMSVALATVVNQVRASAETVVTSSGQVAAATMDLSRHTEHQASSLEETAASMEELASSVKQNADNASQADELARGASRRAQQGGVEVVNVVTTMDDINAAARRIADIVSVIDEIAFQTSILALNAAVEAARAGEQGRGFAVVASEVRALAQRSAEAAKEIKGLISASVEKVENGMAVVERAGDTIQALVVDVKRVSDLMGSIAEASAEQSRGVQQVNRTVTEMDRVVQQNASAVQQSASAAEGMRRQAESLAHAVSAFRVAAARHEDVPPAPRAPGVPAMPPRLAKPAMAGVELWEES